MVSIKQNLRIHFKGAHKRQASDAVTNVAPGSVVFGSSVSRVGMGSSIEAAFLAGDMISANAFATKSQGPRVSLG